MSRSNITLVSREAWPYLTILVILVFIVQYFLGLGLSLLVWLMFLIVAYVFRDPDRVITSEPLAVVCPVDGCITSIDTINHPYLDGEAVCIMMQMNKFGAYRVRSPIEGKVMQQWFLLPGDSLPKLQGAVSRLHMSHWVQSDEGENVVISMRENSRFFHPQCNIQVGERMGQGQKCGIIPLGSQVSIYLPVNVILKQETGACLAAGTDVLAYLRHEPVKTH